MKEEIKNILINNFDDLFICTRTWSAWSYATMTHDDFIPLVANSNLLDEITENLSYATDIDTIEEIFNDYNFYYNSDIDNNFYSQAFDDDWHSHYNVKHVFKSILDLNKISLKLNNPN